MRKVDGKGQVWIYGRSHYVNKKLSGQQLYVYLDPQDCEWVFATPKGVQVCRKAAKELTQESILKLQVIKR